MSKSLNSKPRDLEKPLSDSTSQNLEQHSKTSSRFAEFSAEELELKNIKKKNFLITVTIAVLFIYLVYKLFFKDPESASHENSTKDYVLPELTIERPHTTVEQSEIVDFTNQEIQNDSSQHSSNLTTQETQDIQTKAADTKQENIIESVEPASSEIETLITKPETEKTQKTDKTEKTVESKQDSSQDLNNLIDSFLDNNNNASVQDLQAQATKNRERLETKKKSSLLLISSNDNSNKEQKEENFDLYLTLKRGKIIDVVVENAINTDYGGEVRAVITQNVFSEWGKNILIPQGSKIFGEYAKGVTDKTGRLFINWTRLDLPTGYKVTFEGNAVDNLGLLGINGKYDRKLLEQITNAFLLSAFDIGIAYGLDKLIEPVHSKDSAQAKNAILQVQSARDKLNTIENTQTTTAQKIDQICSSVLALVDMNSQSYTNLNSYCQEVKTYVGSSDETSQYNSLVNRFNSELDQLLIANNQTTEETQVQLASKDAYTDLTDSIRNLLFESQNWEPTVTIAQGARIKIYVRQDYQFPKNAILSYDKVLFIK